MKNYFSFGPGCIAAIRLHWRRTLVHWVILLSNANRKHLHLFAIHFISGLKKSFQFAGFKAPFRGLGVLCASVLLWQSSLHAQANNDNQFAKPLKEVLNDIQKKYNVTIKFADSMVANKKVTYAGWKYRPDVELTLESILTPLELKVKKEGDKKYKLSAYEYFRWQPAEGWGELDRIAAQYKTLQEWESRKTALKLCMKEALQLAQLPALPNNKPVITAVRKFDGYTVQNIAIEILPGLWINGSLYKPAKYKGKIPVILNPDGHWEKQRYRADCQYRCAAFAKMGAMAFSYDLFAWGESLLQFKLEDHRRSLSMTIQALGSIRILDYLLAQKDADTNRVAITGGSGAGSHSVLMTVLDDRIKVSAPVVAISSYFYGGCPCESGMDIHSCGGRTDNVELAAMAAPRPMLVVSDGGDWTDRMPEHDFLYLQKMYSWYGKKDNVQNIHLPAEKHDFGINKRTAVYNFMAKQLGLQLKNIQDAAGNIDESGITIEKESLMYVFCDTGENLPAKAIRGFAELEMRWNQLQHQ